MTALTTPILEEELRVLAGWRVLPGAMQHQVAGLRSGQTQTIPCSTVEPSAHGSSRWTALLGSDSWSEGVGSLCIWQKALPALCQVPEAPSTGGWTAAQ